MRFVARCSILILLACAGPILAQAEDSPGPTVVEVADDVFAVLQPHAGRFDDSNVIVIEGSDAVMIVDAPTDTEFISTVIKEVRARTKAPVRYVVNTHWHGDHTQGNALYRDAFGDVTFIGHHSLREEIPGRAAADITARIEQYETMIPQAEAQLAKGLGLRGQELDEAQQKNQALAIEQARGWLAANRDVEFVVPQLTYDERLELDLGEMTVQLLHQRAHTSGDTVVWLPERKVLATGDMLDDLPYVGHGHPRSWIESLEALAGLPFEKIVPGHGPVFEGPAQLDKLKGFLAALVAHTDAAAKRGTTPEQAVESFEASPWREKLAGEDAGGQRFFDAVLAEAVTRALEEKTGSPAAD